MLARIQHRPVAVSLGSNEVNEHIEALLTASLGNSESISCSSKFRHFGVEVFLGDMKLSDSLGQGAQTIIKLQTYAIHFRRPRLHYSTVTDFAKFLG